MNSCKYDLIIIGDGSIGLVSAYKLFSYDRNLKICIISENQKSATKAAGAMHAAFGEIEKNFYESNHEKKILELALASRLQYINYFKQNGGLNKFIQSYDTLVYLNKSKNFFEKENYFTMKDIVQKKKYHKKISDKFISKLQNKNINDSTLIKSEFTFNPITFLNSLKNNLVKKIIFKHAKCLKIKNSKDGFVEIFTDKNEKIIAKKLIYCGGSNMINELFGHKIKNLLFYGVGSALLLKGPSHELDKKKICIRTVNRGGSQCGLHVLPYGEGKYYVGAGNYVSQNFSDSHRATTINYLSNLAKNEIFGDDFFHFAQMELLIGMRSKSLDGYPMLGPINKNIILASGFNRVGLTLAFEIADLTKKYFFDEKVDSYYDSWLPTRKPIPYKNLHDAAHFFASSRTANLLEHQLIEKKSKIIDVKFKELYDLSIRLNEKIVKKYNFDKDFVLHPDTYRLFTND